MADEINEVQVEKLTLQIDVKGATASQTKKINAFAESLKNLNNALSDSLINKVEKLNKLNLGFGKVSGLSKMTKSMAKTQKQIEESLHLPAVIQKKPKPEMKRLGYEHPKNWQYWSPYGTWLTPYQKPKPKVNLDDKQAGQYRPNDNVVDVEPVKEKTLKTYSDFWRNLKDGKKVASALGKTFSKFTRTLKKGAKMIGIVIAYSMAFRALQMITEGVTKGVSNLAVFDKQANKTLSDLTTATNNLQNAIGMLIMPLVEVITPSIQKISSGLVNIANKVSEITASAKGLATYTKISSKYMNDYARSIQGTSFSFDSFTALQSSVFDMYDMEEVSLSTADANKEMNKFKNTLLVVGSLIAGIFVASKIQTFVTALSGVAIAFKTISGIGLMISGAIIAISSGIDMIINGFSWESFIAMVTGLAVLVAGIGLVFGGIPALIAGIVAAVIALVAVIVGNWDWIVEHILNPMRNFFVTIGDYIKTFFTTILPNFFVDAWNMIIDGWDYVTKKLKEFWDSLPEWAKAALKLIANIFIGYVNFVIGLFEGILLKIPTLIVELVASLFGAEKAKEAAHNMKSFSFPRIPYLANGGMVNAGSLFIAGESGAELITNMGSGTTGVTNVSQFKQAMIEAIYETGLLSSIEESGNIYLDSEKVGKKMGQTKSLRQQLNRTNPNLNLR